MFLNHKRRAKLYKFLKVKKLPFKPYILNIEPGNICNLHCPLCPTGQGDSSMGKGFLSFQLFQKIFSELSPEIDCVNLYSWGEPLLNPELGKIIRHIKCSGTKIRVVTSTNLNVKENMLLEDLITSGIDEIIVSCDGASKETYGIYRVGGDFDLVLENMKYLVARKKKLSVETKIIWNFLVFKHNEHEVEKARQLAQELGVDFRIGLMRTSMKDEILKPHSEAIAKDKEWIPDDPKYSAYDKEKLAPHKTIKSCRKPWQEITVNWNGDVYPCCAVFGKQFALGSGLKSSLSEIWNNSKFIAARREILNNKAKATTICGICRDNGFMHM